MSFRPLTTFQGSNSQHGSLTHRRRHRHVPRRTSFLRRNAAVLSVGLAGVGVALFGVWGHTNVADDADSCRQALSAHDTLSRAYANGRSCHNAINLDNASNAVIISGIALSGSAMVAGSRKTKGRRPANSLGSSRLTPVETVQLAAIRVASWRIQ